MVLFIFSNFQRLISKRAAKLIYTDDENTLILGDKTGDVYTLNIDLKTLNDQKLNLLMGHLSMITDMVNTIFDSFVTYFISNLNYYKFLKDINNG